MELGVCQAVNSEPDLHPPGPRASFESPKKEQSGGRSSQHAILVGIADYPSPISDLSMCVHDVREMKKFLMRSYQFPENNITTLLDGQATSAAFKNALNRLVETVRPGDSVVIFFSGHGGQVVDLDSDEKDNLDEVLITVDYRADKPATWITDDVLRHELSRMRTDRCLVILDSCHAGTGTRALFEEAKFQNLGFGHFALMPKEGPIEQRRSVGGAAHVLLAACAAGEVARDVKGEGGLFTRCLLQQLSTEESHNKALRTLRPGVGVPPLFEPIAMRV